MIEHKTVQHYLPRTPSRRLTSNMALHTSFLQDLLSHSTVVLVVDNAKSPALPVSRPVTGRRRSGKNLKRRRSHPESVSDRWELQAPTSHQVRSPASNTMKEPQTDVAAKLPVRSFSCENLISNVLASLTILDEESDARRDTDIAPTMPRRSAALVLSQRIV